MMAFQEILPSKFFIYFFFLPSKPECEGVSRSLQTGCLEQELQMVQLSAIRYSSAAILWISPVSFATITLCVASHWVFVVVVVVVVDFIFNSVQKILDTPSYMQLPPIPHVFMMWCFSIGPPLTLSMQISLPLCMSYTNSFRADV
jgi:hypothetical protein